MEASLSLAILEVDIHMGEVSLDENRVLDAPYHKEDQIDEEFYNIHPERQGLHAINRPKYGDVGVADRSSHGVSEP